MNVECSAYPGAAKHQARGDSAVARGARRVQGASQLVRIQFGILRVFAQRAHRVATREPAIL